MNNISDNELFVMALEENEDAKNILFRRYKYIIDILLKKYRKMAYKVGIESKDLYSEALYGFSDALVNFCQDKPASIATFLTLCIERRLQKQIIRAGRKKNKINTEAYSLDQVYDILGISYKDLISDDQKYDPLNSIMSRESYLELLKEIKERLSDAEYTVFSFLVNGFNYIQIAHVLGKSSKQVDNTIQRLKVKVRDILKTRKNA